MLLRCQPGFEHWLSKEIAARGLNVDREGGGWVSVRAGAASNMALETLCFAHAALLEEHEVTGDSVNALAEQVLQFFFSSSRDERFENSWPFLIDTAAGLDGLGRRSDAVARAVLEMLKKRMSRVAKLASDERPDGVGVERGLFLYFADFKQVTVSRLCYFGGQRRMADDDLAPSRSYLKVEEAYRLLQREPAPGETVVDLGAAPGGWSYSAAKRGARVIAVDNGPLKGGALNNPLVEHQREDAFSFEAPANHAYDWLFCDLLEEPHHVMRNIVDRWIERRWCRHFVVILKFGRTDAIALLRDLQDPKSILQQRSRNVRIRHLFHDREELSIVGEVVT